MRAYLRAGGTAMGGGDGVTGQRETNTTPISPRVPTRRRSSMPSEVVSRTCPSVTTSGNSRLKSEKSKSFNFGVVWSPKGALEVVGRTVVAAGDPVIDQYRRKLSMALF